MSPKKIAGKKIEEISDFFLFQTREIEKAQFHYVFLKGSVDLIFAALKNYQNEDGGFGHGLEPDFRLPLSTPMATSIGLRILDQLPKSPKKTDMIRKTESFLLQAYNSRRKGWFAVREEVNSYPHAPWWAYDPETKISIIDNNWGNPSAEILAYLVKYKYVFSPKIHRLIPDCLSHAMANLINKTKFGSENEIFCYLALYPNLDATNQQKLKPKIREAIKTLAVLDATQWEKYVPQPVEFLRSPSTERFSFPEEHIDRNLDFLVEKLNRLGHFSPTWDFPYPEEMKRVPKEWGGQLTLKYLKILRNYQRIDLDR